MSYYFPDLIAAIDVPGGAEAFAERNIFAGKSGAARRSRRSDSAAAASELDRLLAQGDREIAMQDAKAAAATFEAILAKYPGLPKAEYGLAIASVMSGNADRAEQLFAKLVSLRQLPAAGCETGRMPRTRRFFPGRTCISGAFTISRASATQRCSNISARWRWKALPKPLAWRRSTEWTSRIKRVRTRASGSGNETVTGTVTNSSTP